MALHEVILDNLDEVVHVIDKDMQILFVNRAVEKLSRWNLKRDEVVGKNLYQVFPFLKETGADKEYKRVFSTGEPIRTEEWTKYHGETIYTVTTKIPIKTKTGETNRVITILRDVTDLKTIEESLQEVADKYFTIVELAQEGICIDDTNEQMVFVNEAFATMLGYEHKEEMLGKTMFDFVDQEGREILESEVNSRRRDTPSRYELTVYTRQGELKYLLVSAVPLVINGTFAGSVSVNLDITERKRAERELERALEEERQFKAKTAHYFFNPLCIAKGYLELVMSEVEDNQREKLEAVRQAVERIENVVENVVTKGEIHE